MDNRLSIYVSSPDSYADVFSVFYKGYCKYWSDCPYEFILTTNTQSYEGITCICNNKQGDSWVERTLAALPQIKSKYILLMCDDLIICDEVNNSQIEVILDYMDNNDIRFCRLNPFPFGDIIQTCPILRRVNKQTPYAINLQVGIFRKDYFEELLGDGSLSAWEIENMINENASNAEDELFKDILATSKIIVPHIHGVYKGEWIRTSIKALIKKDIYTEFDRPLISFFKEIKIILIDWLQWRISPKNRRALKRVFKVFGSRFSTNI